MSSINNVGGNSPINRIVPKTITQAPAAEQSKPSRAADRLELSGASHLLKALKAGGDVRADKVAQIKSQIEAGTYEDENKLDVASSRLLDDLLK
jgi:anti-sigma28 factor (negative regulator of flagellin synthesis)